MCADPPPGRARRVVRPRPCSDAPPLRSYLPSAKGKPRLASPDRGAPSLTRYAKRMRTPSCFCSHHTTLSSSVEIDCAHGDFHSGVLSRIPREVRPGLPLERHPPASPEAQVGGPTGGSGGIPDWLVRKPVNTSGGRRASPRSARPDPSTTYRRYSISPAYLSFFVSPFVSHRYWHSISNREASPAQDRRPPQLPYLGKRRRRASNARDPPR